MTPFDVLDRVTGLRWTAPLVQPWKRVHTDTRSLQAGDFFVALKGERFDAHDFLPQALQIQLAGAMVSERANEGGTTPLAVVPDTRAALSEWARAWRASLSMPLIAVTGSNGKTTVTQMLASILRAAHGENMHATQGNFNNDIGVPLTLLRLRETDARSVVELGMNHPGEIAGLAAMAQPDVAVVNNAQREHQEFMRDVESVARENASVFAHLRANGAAVFPSDDEHTSLWRSLVAQGNASVRVFTFSDRDAQATVHGHAQWVDGGWQVQMKTPVGEAVLRLQIAGRHNVRNALAAAAAALASGVSLQHVCAGLQAFVPVQGRSRWVQLPPSAQQRTRSLVDDTYNANPDSVLAAIAVLQELPGPRWLALGDMGEVGEQGLAFHQEVLQSALRAGFEHIDVTGEWMRQAVAQMPVDLRLQWHDSVEALLLVVPQRVSVAASTLVKGSRFMRMERVVEAVMQAAGSPITGGGAHAH